MHQSYIFLKNEKLFKGKQTEMKNFADDGENLISF